MQRELTVIGSTNGKQLRVSLNDLPGLLKVVRADGVKQGLRGRADPGRSRGKFRRRGLVHGCDTQQKTERNYWKTMHT